MADHNDKNRHDKDTHGMGMQDKNMRNKGQGHDTDLPVPTEGGSEGLLNPEKAGRAREEAKRRGDQVTAQKSKDLEHRSLEEFAQKLGHQTYDADPKNRSKDKAKGKSEPPLDQRKSDG